MFVGECITTSRNNLFFCILQQKQLYWQLQLLPKFFVGHQYWHFNRDFFLPKVGLLILLEIVVLCLISIPKNIHTSSTTLLACNCDMSWVLASLLLPQFSAFSFLRHFVAYAEFDLSYFDTQVTFLTLILNLTFLTLTLILLFLFWQLTWPLLLWHWI